MENSISEQVLSLAKRIDALPDELVASFKYRTVLERRAKIRRVLSDLAISSLPFTNWLERKKHPGTADLVKRRLLDLQEHMINCGASEIPEYKGGAIASPTDEASPGLKEAGRFAAQCLILANNIRKWLDEIEPIENTNQPNKKRNLEETKKFGEKFKSPSGKVKLFERHEKPIVNGMEKDVLTKAQYDVIKTLIEAGRKGLSKDQLDIQSSHGDSRKVLYRLAEDSDWKKVLPMPGTTGKGYRIL